MIRGEYVIYPGEAREIIVKNTVLEKGQQRLMRSAFRAATGGEPIASFDLGLFEEVPAYDSAVADITTEPTATGGYARKTIAATTANWTITSVNNEAMVESATQTFTATGADFSRTFSRMFLMETSGEIISYSAALQVPRLLLDTESFPVKYRFFFE